MPAIVAVIIAYWPAIVAALYLLYVLAAAVGGNVAIQGQILPAVAALVAAAQLNHQSVTGKAIAKEAHAAVFPPVEPLLKPSFDKYEDR